MKIRYLGPWICLLCLSHPSFWTSSQHRWYVRYQQCDTCGHPFPFPPIWDATLGIPCGISNQTPYRIPYQLQFATWAPKCRYWADIGCTHPKWHLLVELFVDPWMARKLPKIGIIQPMRWCDSWSPHQVLACLKHSVCLCMPYFPGISRDFSPTERQGSDLLLERTLEAPSVDRQLAGSGLFGLSPCGPAVAGRFGYRNMGQSEHCRKLGQKKWHGGTNLWGILAAEHHSISTHG